MARVVTEQDYKQKHVRLMIRLMRTEDKFERTDMSFTKAESRVNELKDKRIELSNKIASLSNKIASTNGAISAIRECGGRAVIRRDGKTGCKYFGSLGLIRTDDIC